MQYLVCMYMYVISHYVLHCIIYSSCECTVNMLGRGRLLEVGVKFKGVQELQNGLEAELVLLLREGGRKGGREEGGREEGREGVGGGKMKERRKWE